MIVPTPAELRRAEDDVAGTSLGGGLAHALPMSEKQLAKAKKRKRKRFGFSAPTSTTSDPVASRKERF